MATVGNSYLSIADVRKRQNPDGDAIADIIEMLAETMPMVEDAPAFECNDGSAHQTTARTGIPEGTFRRLYQGTQPTKSTTRQVRDTTGMIENWSEIDSKLVQLSNDPAGLRMSEAQAFIEGLGQTAEETIIYGNTDNTPEKFDGFAPRFSDLSAENAKQIIDAGGSGSNNTSIWFVVWSERSNHLIYPEGSQAGLQRDDKGMQTKTFSDGKVMDVHREKFTWDLGLTVRDWRYVARIANIDVTQLTPDGATGAKLFDLMVTAYWRLFQRRVARGRAAIYCNATIMEYLDHQTRAGSDNIHLTWREYGPDSEPVLTFRNMPIREADAILNTEAQVT